jgi:hypothetical protein
MLNKLTKKQERLMIEVRNEWLDRIFKCKVKKEDARCVELVKWLYKISNLKEPLVVFLDSPLAIQYGANQSQVWSQVESQVRSQVESQVRSQVWSQVESQVESQVRSQVGSQVRSQVWSQVWSQVGSQVRSQVGSQVWSQVGSQELKVFEFCYYGDVWDYGWISFYDFFGRLGIKNENLELFKELMTYDIFTMIQLDGICFISRHPEHILRDTENRMHSIEKSAIRFKDGYEQHYIHGVYFDKDLWERLVGKKMSFKEIASLKNIEQRIIALKLYGPENLLKEVRAELLDKSERGNELYGIDSLIGGRTLKLLKYSCPSTNRLYVSFVPDEHTKADSAMAWKFSINEFEYKQLKAEA